MYNPSQVLISSEKVAATLMDPQFNGLEYVDEI